MRKPEYRRLRHRSGNVFFKLQEGILFFEELASDSRSNVDPTGILLDFPAWPPISLVRALRIAKKER